MPYADPVKQRTYLTRYSRTWYWRNREKDLARQKAWREANKDKLATARKRFREANKERLAADTRRRREADPERNLQIWRKSHYKTTYGITVAEFDAMFAAQCGRCAICASDKPGGRWKRFAVDHCHNSNKVRGLLCTKCNTNLGALEVWYAKHKAKIDSYLAGAK